MSGRTLVSYTFIQSDTTLLDGAHVLVAAFGQLQFAVLLGGVFITDDGEAIEGEALDDVTVIGTVTALINAVERVDDSPVL